MYMSQLFKEGAGRASIHYTYMEFVVRKRICWNIVWLSDYWKLKVSAYKKLYAMYSIFSQVFAVWAKNGKIVQKSRELK